MGVLARCLRDYEIDWRAATGVHRHGAMARRAFPELPNHKLDTLSHALDISLMHHDAGSDALCCARVFLECIRRGLRPEDYVRTYDMMNMQTLREVRRRG